jgi:hypothetical protein
LWLYVDSLYKDAAPNKTRIIYVAISLSVTQMKKRRQKRPKFPYENNSVFLIGFVKTLILWERLNTRSNGEGQAS